MDYSITHLTHLMLTTNAETNRTDSKSLIERLNEHSDELLPVHFVAMAISLPLLAFGTIGNFLSLVVMRRKSFRGSPVSVYLSLLAIADTVFIVVGIPHEWLEWFNVDMQLWVCKIHRFLFYTSGDIAIWLIVLFTFDRLIAVCFPLHKKQISSSSTAVKSSIITSLLLTAKNMHVFWTRGVELNATRSKVLNYCGIILEYDYFERFVRPWIAFAVAMAIPFVIIITSNLIIISFFCSRARNSISSTNSESKNLRQTTIMCLSVSFTFLVCIAPSIVLLIGKPYLKSNHYRQYTIAKVINNQLVYFNHSINFCLYCLTGSRFRIQLMKLMGLNRDVPNTSTSNTNKSNSSNLNGKTNVYSHMNKI